MGCPVELVRQQPRQAALDEASHGEEGEADEQLPHHSHGFLVSRLLTAASIAPYPSEANLEQAAATRHQTGVGFQVEQTRARMRVWALSIGGKM